MSTDFIAISLQSALVPDVTIGIEEILGVIASIITLVIAYVMERRALARWRFSLWF